MTIQENQQTNSSLRTIKVSSGGVLTADRPYNPAPTVEWPTWKGIAHAPGFGLAITGGFDTDPPSASSGDVLTLFYAGL